MLGLDAVVPVVLIAAALLLTLEPNVLGVTISEHQIVLAFFGFLGRLLDGGAECAAELAPLKLAAMHGRLKIAQPVLHPGQCLIHPVARVGLGDPLKRLLRTAAVRSFVVVLPQLPVTATTITEASRSR